MRNLSGDGGVFLCVGGRIVWGVENDTLSVVSLVKDKDQMDECGSFVIP